jgi:holo-[acyl-carrier protein] synthase
MILGIGIDIVAVPRISRLMERYGSRFLAKVFTDGEIAEGRERVDGASYFAARFAAREAFFKALGTGWGRGIALRDVGVTRGALGKPSLELSSRAQKALADKQIAHTHLSLTHEGDLAQAIVILEGGRDD